MSIPENLKKKNLLPDASFINGRPVPPADGNAFFPVFNPADGSVLARVAGGTADDTHDAITAASQAFGPWALRSPAERSRLLLSWRNCIMENRDDLALLLSLEQGKPISESKAEITYGASYLRWFAEEARRIYGDIIPAAQEDSRAFVIRQPAGVVAAITPWNFPNAMIARKAAPALAAGCTMVLKPSEETPLSALAMAVLAKKAGIPDGVFNVIATVNADEAGRVLTESPVVRKLSFTGSTEVGKHLLAACAGTVKKVSMELGGNAPFIVFEDADIDAAVDGAMASKFRNSGQTCVCANRFFIHDSVYEAFTEKFISKTRSLKTGSFHEPGVCVGPLINENAILKIQSLIDDATGKGAEVLYGGKRLSSKGGFFFEPTVIGKVSPDMRCFSGEIFGPVAPLISFGNEDEVVRQANATSYGLASYFYGRDTGRIWRVAEALESGMVGVNTGIMSNEAAPFGGIKESGIGREGSRYGIDDYLELKYICLHS